MSNRLSNEEIVRQILCKDMENISEEEDIIHLLLNQQVTENLNNSHQDTATKGDKIADRLASVAGSWSFILGFGAVLLLWILINTVVITVHAFDPYPFILLNLI